jgi:hypothetical protein
LLVRQFLTPLLPPIDREIDGTSHDPTVKFADLALNF